MEVRPQARVQPVQIRSITRRQRHTQPYLHSRSDKYSRNADTGAPISENEMRNWHILELQLYALQTALARLRNYFTQVFLVILVNSLNELTLLVAKCSIIY